MVHKCIVRGCKSEWHPQCKTSFHVFPKDVERRNKWLSIIPLKTQFYEKAEICSLHFKSTDFKDKRLTWFATPFYVETFDCTDLLENTRIITESAPAADLPMKYLVIDATTSMKQSSAVAVKCKPDDDEYDDDDNEFPDIERKLTYSEISLPFRNGCDMSVTSLPSACSSSNVPISVTEVKQEPRSIDQMKQSSAVAVKCKPDDDEYDDDDNEFPDIESKLTYSEISLPFRNGCDMSVTSLPSACSSSNAPISVTEVKQEPRSIDQMKQSSAVAVKCKPDDDEYDDDDNEFPDIERKLTYSEISLPFRNGCVMSVTSLPSACTSFNVPISVTEVKQEPSSIDQTNSEISLPVHNGCVMSVTSLPSACTSSNVPISVTEVKQEPCSIDQVSAELPLIVNNTPSKKRTYSDSCVQARLKTDREKKLWKKNKVLLQKLRRQKKSINHMKALLSEVKNYTAHTEIENIIKGNFAEICKLFNKPDTTKHVRYCDEVKAFALNLLFYSPKAYDFLRKHMSLPHPKTIRKASHPTEPISVTASNLIEDQPTIQE